MKLSNSETLKSSYVFEVKEPAATISTFENHNYRLKKSKQIIEQFCVNQTLGDYLIKVIPTKPLLKPS